MASVRTATIGFGLEDRPETAVNGAAAGAAVSIATELTALVVNFDADSMPFVLISGDIVWFPSALAATLRHQISELAGTEADRVCLAASHTHGTPNSERQFRFEQWSKNLETHICDAVLQVAGEALQQEHKRARLKTGSIELAGPAINRRRRAIAFRPNLSYRMQNLPNGNGKCDNRVNVVLLESPATGQPIALIVRYTCHPVADANTVRGADYPGFSRETVRRQLGIAVPILFLQGFCGDVRPNLQLQSSTMRDRLIKLLVGPRFRKPHDGDAERIGECLGSSIVDVLTTISAHPEQTSELACKVASAHRRQIELQLSDTTIATLTLDLTTWNWPQLTFIFASGEMLSGLLPQTRSEHCLCIGYANGMVGYVPAAADLQDGGYEVDASREKFRLSARLGHKTCQQLADVIQEEAAR